MVSKHERVRDPVRETGSLTPLELEGKIMRPGWRIDLAQTPLVELVYKRLLRESFRNLVESPRGLASSAGRVVGPVTPRIGVAFCGGGTFPFNVPSLPARDPGCRQREEKVTSSQTRSSHLLLVRRSISPRPSLPGPSRLQRRQDTRAPGRLRSRGPPPSQQAEQLPLSR